MVKDQNTTQSTSSVKEVPNNFEISRNAKVILEKRYLRDGESPKDLFKRVAQAISHAEPTESRELWESIFFEMLSTLKFLPNSPTLVNAGTQKGCLSACFVVTPDDTMESIMEVAHDAAMIEKWGGGIGFGFSKLRPKNDKISTTHGQACGPVAVMKLYSSIGATLTQGSFRLGAHMGQIRDSHPDIREFIHCKDNDDTLQNFNISVQITDAFMHAVETNAEWDLVNPRDEGEGPTETVSARELWDEITTSAWQTGDPGVVFIDRVWETAPNPQMGRIETSNPCGEEFLEDHGNCCLGSINLDKHITLTNQSDNEHGSTMDFDWELLEETIRTSVRFLDDVIEVNKFPLTSLREVNLATRRIGLGVMGWADALVRLNIPYDSDDALKLADKLGGFINRTAWDESGKLAEERGPFPEYPNSALHKKGMPPVRNSSVITIAPTGTISRISGCSSGIEPHFAIAWWSNVLWEDHQGTSSRLLDAPTSVWDTLSRSLENENSVEEILKLLADNPNDVDTILKEHNIDAAVLRTSMAISPEAHVRMQAAWQKHVTNSVSKTINLPNQASVQDVKDAYLLAWQTDCKAVTVYRDGSKAMQVLETGVDTSQKSEQNQPLLSPRQRPASVSGVTDRVRTGHGNMYVTVNFDDQGHAFETFTTVGKAGGCDSANLDAICRLVSMALRSGVDPSEVIDQLKGITCCPVWDNGTLVRSAPDAVALTLSNHIVGDHKYSDINVGNPTSNGHHSQLGMFNNATKQNNGYIPVGGTKCPKCSGKLIHQEGCERCLECGHTKCE